MRGHSGFAQLRIFAQNGTSPFSQAFCDWQSRYHHIECDWKEASARTFGIVRVPTATDFAREDSAGEPTWEPQCHPFYSCPHDLSAARNIWVLPAAPAWWHQVLWGLQREWDGREYEDPEDIRQADLRWRLFRAAGELWDKAGCSLRWTRTTRTPSRSMAIGRRPMASVSSASGTIDCPPCEDSILRSAVRVRPAAATGMGRTPTAWVTLTSTTSISTISPRAALVHS
jgi:hypothetical protein